MTTPRYPLSIEQAVADDRRATRLAIIEQVQRAIATTTPQGKSDKPVTDERKVA